MKINVLVDSEYKGKLKTPWLRRVVTQVLKAEGARPQTEVGLVITGQEKIRELNRTYRHIDRPTDVLAFSLTEGETFVPAPDGVTRLGEVIISYPQAQLQAEERKHPVEKEVALLLIHGALHLLGYDHEKAGEAKRMRVREEELLRLVEEAE